MKKLLISVLFGFVFLAQAVLANENIADSIQLEGKNLQLNGVGVRTKFFMDIYSGAFYSEASVKDFTGVLKNKHNARVSMKIIYSKVTDEQFKDAWIEGFEKNLNAQEQKQFKTEIDQFLAAFPTVQRDGVVDVDFLSGGVTVSINSKNVVTISTPDFNQALLRIWFGEHPAHEGLMEGMLGI